MEISYQSVSSQRFFFTSTVPGRIFFRLFAPRISIKSLQSAAKTQHKFSDSNNIVHKFLLAENDELEPQFKAK